MKNTTRRGDITEFEVMTALARSGKTLLRPMSSATRYDVLIDNEDGTFTRVQCKTGRLRDGCVRFGTYSVSGHTTRLKGYRGQVDAFGVHCPQTGETYLVPIDELGSVSAVVYLRVSPARNGQQRRTRAAYPYRINASHESTLLP